MGLSSTRLVPRAGPRLPATIKELRAPYRVVCFRFFASPEIFSFGESGLCPDKASEVIRPALESALDGLMTMRAAEGADLKKDLLSRLAILEKATKTIAAETPIIVTRQRDLLQSRLRDAGIELDLEDDRLLKELPCLRIVATSPRNPPVSIPISVAFAVISTRTNRSDALLTFFARKSTGNSTPLDPKPTMPAWAKPWSKARQNSKRFENRFKILNEINKRHQGSLYSLHWWHPSLFFLSHADPRLRRYSRKLRPQV